MLTAQLARIDTYTHLRAQIWTSVPAFLIAAIAHPAGAEGHGSPEADTDSELNQLDQLFWITPGICSRWRAHRAVDPQGPPAALAITA